MNSKQRDVVFQRWRGEIGREARDLDSLEQTSRRAMIDSDVREDAQLQSMIRVEVQKRRAELVQKSQRTKSSPSTPRTKSADQATAPEPIPTLSPMQVQEAFKKLAETLSTSLECGDETETADVLKRMRALQAESPSAISEAAIGAYEQRVQQLRIHIKQLTEEIAALTDEAISAARDGSESPLARSMRRLTAIHVAHPRLIDEPGLEDVRRRIAQAADERQQRKRTTKKLLERERAITAEIKTLAVAVRNLRGAACTAAPTSDEFRQAEANYLRVIRTVRMYDTEWFSGVVLELADLLAEWTVPPLGAGGQIDRFLDSISAGLDSIRVEMRKIKSERDAGEGH